MKKVKIFIIFIFLIKNAKKFRKCFFTFRHKNRNYAQNDHFFIFANKADNTLRYDTFLFLNMKVKISKKLFHAFHSLKYGNVTL